MIKIICDICGKNISLERPVKSKFNISSNGRTWDICHDCRYAFDIWVGFRKSVNSEERSKNGVGKIS